MSGGGVLVKAVLVVVGVLVSDGMMPAAAKAYVKLRA